MKECTVSASAGDPQRGPSPLTLSVIYLLLFAGGVIAATRLAGGATYVSPFAGDAAILDFFRKHADAVRVQGFVVLASSIPLGFYAVTVSNRLNILGIRTAGTKIALFGGLGASFILALSGMAQWILSQQSIAMDDSATLSWQNFAFITGGPGYASLLGLMIGGITIPSYLLRLLPRWVCLWGIALGFIGQLSLLSLLQPQASYLIPLTRFLGFIWLIVSSALLPRATRVCKQLA